MFAKIKKVIARIPKGKVATYGQIAKMAGYPGAARQVVWALHGSTGLPWHRVLGAGGKILLPGQNGMEQRIRLEMEGVQFHGAKVDMKSFGWEPKGQTKLKRSGTKAVGSAARTRSKGRPIKD
ncbi:MAG TPA: MGMT family protein [Terriglobales bacterium]|nr:MGMT family protein [Terriglobales bacterium]